MLSSVRAIACLVEASAINAHDVWERGRGLRKLTVLSHAQRFVGLGHGSNNCFSS